jgi:hypothetical protein
MEIEWNTDGLETFVVGEIPDNFKILLGTFTIEYSQISIWLYVIFTFLIGDSKNSHVIFDRNTTYKNIEIVRRLINMNEKISEIDKENYNKTLERYKNLNRTRNKYYHNTHYLGVKDNELHLMLSNSKIDKYSGKFIVDDTLKPISEIEADINACKQLYVEMATIPGDFAKKKYVS